MNGIFIIIAVIYNILLAISDSLVNRLIFRDNHKLSYFSPEKQIIYRRSEWVIYCTIFLIILPIILPVIIAYLIGGLKFVLIYLLILTLVEWDMIFGKIVFNNWFGDLPSICLPKIGWLHFKLWPTIVVRLLIALIILFFYLQLNKT